LTEFCKWRACVTTGNILLFLIHFRKKKHFDSSYSGIWNFSQDATPLIIFLTLLSEDVLSLFQEELQILIDCLKRMKTRKALKLDRKLILAFFGLCIETTLHPSSSIEQYHLMIPTNFSKNWVFLKVFG